MRQSYPQKVVREGLRALGHTAEADRSVHFSYEIVALSPKAARELAERFGEEYRLSAEDEKKPFVEMSGRKGLGVKADDLVELLLERSRAEIGSRRGADAAGGAAAAEQDARAIAVGALRYFLLKVGRNKVIAFDFDEALNFEGDTGPVPPVLARAGRQHLPQARGEGHPRRAGLGEAPTARTGTTTSGPSRSTPPRPRTSPSGPWTRSSSPPWRGTPSAWRRASTTSTTASRSSRKPTPPSGTAGSPIARIFRTEMSRLLSLLGIPEPGRM